DVPASMAAVIDRALAADPAKRYATAGEFADALSQVIEYETDVDPTSALGIAVHHARVKRGSASDRVPVGSDAATIPQRQRPIDEQFCDEFDDVVPLTNPKKK